MAHDALAAWRACCERHGVRGVCRKSNPKYAAIKRDYEAMKGQGFFGNLAKSALKSLAPKAIDALGGLAKDQLGKLGGEGVKRRGRPRKVKGDGLFGDLTGIPFL
jgi:hypothetical protein